MQAALAFDRKVILERAVDAREVECAVLGNDDPQASVPGEIVVGARHAFYSYDAKYVDPDGAALRIPADIAPALRERVRALSVQTFKALELTGMARVDFFLDRGTGDLYVNEVNTIPGFTASEVRDAPATLAAAGQALGFPLFVKPANTGSWLARPVLHV